MEDEIIFLPVLKMQGLLFHLMNLAFFAESEII
jgi:hypothetical protein